MLGEAGAFPGWFINAEEAGASPVSRPRIGLLISKEQKTKRFVNASSQSAVFFFSFRSEEIYSGDCIYKGQGPVVSLSLVNSGSGSHHRERSSPPGQGPSTGSNL